MNDAVAFWHIEDEIQIIEYFPQPRDRAVWNYQWWCTSCGRIWARLVFDNLQHIIPAWKGMWRMQSSRCLKCGDGILLDVPVFSSLRGIPIPQDIFERELNQAIATYRRYHNGTDILARQGTMGS